MPVETESPMRFGDDDPCVLRSDARIVCGILVQVDRVFSARVPVHQEMQSRAFLLGRLRSRGDALFRTSRSPREGPALCATHTHEVISHGFWPGGGAVLEPAFYACACPSRRDSGRACVGCGVYPHNWEVPAAVRRRPARPIDGRFAHSWTARTGSATRRPGGTARSNSGTLRHVGRLAFGLHELVDDFLHGGAPLEMACTSFLSRARPRGWRRPAPQSARHDPRSLWMRTTRGERLVGPE
jgi:hypothetical protein